MGKLRLKNVLKYQQGGGLSVFTPEPRNFMTPLEGLAPQALTYDLRVNPIDTSQFSKAVQFQQQLDFEKGKLEKDLAIRREELQFRKDNLEASLQSKWYDTLLDQFKESKKITGAVNGNGNYLSDEDDLTKSPWVLAQNAEYQAALTAQQKAMEKLILGNRFDTKNFLELKNQQAALEGTATKMADWAKLKADNVLHNRLIQIHNDENSDIQLYNPLFADYLTKRYQYMKDGTNYTPGQGFNGMFSKSNEAANVQAILKESRAVYTESKVTVDEYGVVKQIEKSVVPDAEMAADLATKSIMQSPATLMYLDQMVLGGKLYGLTNDADKAKAIKEYLVSQYKADDESIKVQQQQETFKGNLGLTKSGGDDKDKTSTAFNPKSFLDIYDAEQKKLITNAWAQAEKGGLNVRDERIARKLAVDALTAKGGLVVNDDYINGLGKSFNFEDVKGALGVLYKNKSIRGYNAEDLQTTITFWANPQLQDAFYAQIYYPTQVKPVYDKIKNGTLKLHPDLANLNDVQIQYVIHNLGKTGGEKYLTTKEIGKKTKELNTQAEQRLNSALAKIKNPGNKTFLEWMPELEGSYSSVFDNTLRGQEEDVASGVGKYQIQMTTYMEDVRKFINDNPQLVGNNLDVISVYEDIAAGGDGSGTAKPNRVFTLAPEKPGTKVVYGEDEDRAGEEVNIEISEEQLKKYGLGQTPEQARRGIPADLQIVTDKDGNTWLYAKRGSERAQRALFNLGLLDEDTNYWNAFSDVNVNEVGRKKIKGLYVIEEGEEVKYKDLIYGKEETAQYTQILLSEKKPKQTKKSQAPTPAPKESKYNPFQDKDKVKAHLEASADSSAAVTDTIPTNQ